MPNGEIWNGMKKNSPIPNRPARWGVPEVLPASMAHEGGMGLGWRELPPFGKPETPNRHFGFGMVNFPCDDCITLLFFWGGVKV